jgi:hypothetical protein
VVPSGLLGCPRVLWCLWVPSGLLGCPRVPWCLRVPSGALGCPRVLWGLSGSLSCFTMTSASFCLTVSSYGHRESF